MNTSNTKAKTADKILAAADELLVEGGHDGISMRAVAEAAGVNKALVFYYFGSKAQLIERVLERYYAAHLEALEGAFVGDGSLSERMHRLVDTYLDFIESNLRYPRLIQQLVAGDDTHDEFIRRSLGPLFEWTTAALSEIAPETGAAAARQLFMSFSGIVNTYYTYARVMAPMWGGDPMSEEMLAERRAHVHWIVDTLLARLAAETA